jgi:hypothetical protein
MPRRDLVCVALFHEDVFVEEPRCFAEQGACQLGKWAVQRGVAVTIDPLPVDIVAEEAPGAVLWRVVVGPRTGCRQILVDGSSELVELPVIEHAANDDHTILLELGLLTLEFSIVSEPTPTGLFMPHAVTYSVAIRSGEAAMRRLLIVVLLLGGVIFVPTTAGDRRQKADVHGRAVAKRRFTQ